MRIPILSVLLTSKLRHVLWCREACNTNPLSWIEHPSHIRGTERPFSRSLVSHSWRKNTNGRDSAAMWGGAEANARLGRPSAGHLHSVKSSQHKSVGQNPHPCSQIEPEFTSIT
ncbi:uncharacterized protein BDZ83DRAFT_611539 [Colletotrichum acutatum]|uniref:Secreted protein n=1 Tax=Glomerella acutata TaxID=27357 RepID=A0AAD8XJE8_GLOAC|nr:uncharacterized protein BDZ83DRAFT_611539 [Colletotrichum acutatum]KAK1727918.1 hypothetical protein BDZ83DRAFT_611539 [Colletotrichum acutatum]